jgi:hypothetical protein
MRRQRRRLGSLALITVAACGSGDSSRPDAGISPAADTTIVRDSAAVAIIENPAGDRMLPLVEELRIGVASGSPEYELHRIADVVLDANGWYHVAMSDGVRVFDAEGAYVRRYGGAGAGPGEFRMAPVLWFSGDTSLALDRNLMRTTAFGAAGQVLSTQDARSKPGMYVVPRTRIGASWVAEVYPTPAIQIENENDRPRVNVEPGERFDPPPTALVRYDPASDALRDTLFRVPRAPMYGYPEAPDGLAAPLFGPHPVYSFDDAGRLYWTRADGYGIEVYDAAGRHVRSIRRAYTPIPIEARDIEELAALLVEGWVANTTFRDGDAESYRREMLPRLQTRVQRQVDAAPMPESRVPLGAIRVSPSGRLAVERADAVPPAVRETRRVTGNIPYVSRWDLFDASGQYEGTAALPEGYHLHAIDDERRLIGVLTDDQNVERVVVYATRN